MAEPAAPASSQTDTPPETPPETPPAPPGEPEGPNTPETFDREYVEKLRRESAGYRTRAQEAEAKIKEIADRDKTEHEKAVERAEQAEQRAAEAERRLLRREVADKAGLPASLAARLQGETEEELLEDAKQLAKLVVPGKPGDDLPDVPRGADRGSANQPTLDEQIAEAEEKGDWDLAGRLKARKLAEARNTT